MEITAQAVKTLREETSLGMMQCKKALEQTNGDIAAAKDLLRSQGLVVAQATTNRATHEGRIAVMSARCSDDPIAYQNVIVEIRCETDFCAKSDAFILLCDKVAQTIHQTSHFGAITETPEITAAIQNLQASVKENIKFTRGHFVAAPFTEYYLHHNGKVGVVLGFDKPVEAAKDICMHVAFNRPLALNTTDIDPTLVAKETEIAKAFAIASGKPESIAEKMVAGKIKKWMEANALMEQPFIKDDKKKVKDILGDAKITDCVCFNIEEIVSEEAKKNYEEKLKRDREITPC